MDIKIFRVRKSPYNLKSQKGAYFMFENAVKAAIKHKCNVYDNNKNCLFNYKSQMKGMRV